MFTTHRQGAARRHTTLLLTAALALGLAASTLLGATGNGVTPNPPGLLPTEANAAAAPMNSDRVASFTANAWQAIELQNVGKWHDAALAWEQSSAPCESEVWRQLSIGVARLYLGELKSADAHLANALELGRENPAVRYFIGLLRIEQSELAREFADAVSDNGVRRAYYVPDQFNLHGHGKAKGRLELEAINELETAITYAAGLEVDSPLADVSWVIPVPYPISQPLAPPTVNELLGSLGADNLAGKAHGLLAHLYLDQGLPDQAEFHIDEAIALGISVPSGYRTAGKLYEERDQHGDAFRVHMKAMSQGEGLVRPGTRALRSFGSALEELFDRPTS